jgi:hypothetical protein
VEFGQLGVWWSVRIGPAPVIVILLGTRLRAINASEAIIAGGPIYQTIRQANLDNRSAVNETGIAGLGRRRHGQLVACALQNERVPRPPIEKIRGVTRKHTRLHSCPANLFLLYQNKRRVANSEGGASR